MSISQLKKPDSRFVLPIIGNIRLGEKIIKTTQAGKKVEVPSATSTFIIKGETEYEKKLIEFLGTDKPETLLSYFPQYNSETIEEWKNVIFPVRYMGYNSQKKLIFDGDDTSGIVKEPGLYRLVTGTDIDEAKFTPTVVYPNSKSGTWDDDELFQELLNRKDGKVISIVGSLKIKIVGFDSPGVFRITTRSGSSIKAIYTYFDSLLSQVGFPYMVATNMRLERLNIKKEGVVHKPYVIRPTISSDWQEYAKDIFKKHEATLKIKENMMSMLYAPSNKTTALPVAIVEEDEYIDDETIVVAESDEYKMLEGEDTEKYFLRMKEIIEVIAKEKGYDLETFLSQNKYSESAFNGEPEKYIEYVLSHVCSF
jgi:hypothetical protein